VRGSRRYGIAVNGTDYRGNVFRAIIDRYLPLPRILHPEPGVRFDAKYPR